MTITRSAQGRYSVRFAGLGGNGTAGGNMQVTAYGSGSESCKVVGWASSSPDFTTLVNCFDNNGNLVDTRYTVFVTWPQAGRQMGYVWADQPTASSYSPSPNYAYNGGEGDMTITRSALGRYLVRFAGFGGSETPGANVQVTAYGSGNESCKVVSWGSLGPDLGVAVNCFDNDGNLVDTRYSVFVTWIR